MRNLRMPCRQLPVYACRRDVRSTVDASGRNGLRGKVVSTRKAQVGLEVVDGSKEREEYV